MGSNPTPASCYTKIVSKEVIFMVSFSERFPDYDVTEKGIVYKNGTEMKPFKSNKYLQVSLYDVNHKKYVCGVHTVVAMKYLEDYEDGCVVHHKDGDHHNNNVNNLQVLSRSEHSRMHCTESDRKRIADYIKSHGPSNKGKKMSAEFCKKCSDSAKLRWQREKYGIFQTE